MSWGKREVNENYVALGDDEGQVKKVGGILVRLVPNTMFDKKIDYEFVDKDGDLALLSGSASLSRQLSHADCGKFFKAEFEGWGKSANGKFKQIAVYVWDGEPTDGMKQWPGFGKYYGKAQQENGATKGAKKSDPLDEVPESLDHDDNDDDLPF
jgi:hypothetical protein